MFNNDKITNCKNVNEQVESNSCTRPNSNSLIALSILKINTQHFTKGKRTHQLI